MTSGRDGLVTNIRGQGCPLVDFNFLFVIAITDSENIYSEGKLLKGA